MDGFEKWLRDLPIDFIQHMWEFYQQDISDDKPLTESDVFNAARELGISTEETLKILQFKVPPTDRKRDII